MFYLLFVCNLNIGLVFKKPNELVQLSRVSLFDNIYFQAQFEMCSKLKMKH